MEKESPLGIEFDSKLILKINNSLNTINLGYAYINDDYENDILSRYSLNSYKHRLILNFDFKLLKSISNYLSYRYGVRESQDEINKSVVDYKITIQRNRYKVILNLNNIFDAKYYDKFWEFPLVVWQTRDERFFEKLATPSPLILKIIIKCIFP